MEKDDEVSGSKNYYNFGARMYDSRIGRFPSMDRFAKKYPGQTPYAFASNMPISAIDVNGDSTYLIIYAAGYLNSQMRGQGHDLGITFKKHALALEKEIRASSHFDPATDDVKVVYAPSTDQFIDATNKSYASGAIKSLTTFSHGYDGGLSLGGRLATDPGSNQATEDSDFGDIDGDGWPDDYDKREINISTMSRIDFSNFGSSATCSFNGCNIGGYYDTDATMREYNAANSFASYFSANSGLKTFAFTGGAETMTNSSGGLLYNGNMIRSVDRGSQSVNFSIFTPTNNAVVPAAQTTP